MSDKQLVQLPTQVLILGDSHSQYGDSIGGWVSLLRADMMGKLIITNLDINTFEQNLREIARVFRERYPTAQLIHFTPPNVGSSKIRKQEQTEKYQQVAIRVAQELNYLHFTPDVKANDGLKDDGIHLDEVGNRRVYEKVKELIKDPPYWRAHWSEW